MKLFSKALWTLYFRNMYNQYSLDAEDLEMLENPESGNELGEDEEPRSG